MRYIAIEGCMGAGKSTLLDMLQRSGEPGSFGVRAVLQEPVKEWGHLLVDFYENPQRNALILQLEILRSRLQQLLDADTDLGLSHDDVVLIERSIESSSDVFVEMMSMSNSSNSSCREAVSNRDDSGSENRSSNRSNNSNSSNSSSSEVMMSSRDVVAYRKWQLTVEGIMHEKRHELAGIIFIDADPDTCLGRIRGRERDGEAGISLEYLKQLRAQYGVWLEDMRRRGIPVTVVTSSTDGEAGMQQLYADTMDAIIRQTKD